MVLYCWVFKVIRELVKERTIKDEVLEPLEERSSEAGMYFENCISNANL